MMEKTTFYNIGKCMSILIIILIVFILQSCEDQFNLKPPDELSDAVYWKSPEDFKLAANGFYSFLESWSHWKDADSDIMVPTTMAAGEELSVSNGNIIAREEDPVWDNCYSNLRDFNYLIKKGEEYEGDKSEISRYIGEAKFFRAYAYFRLLKRFGGVPLILKPLDIDSEELSKKRASRDKVVDQILSDLDYAISNLPKESEISADQKGRISKGGALGYKARVALYEGTWQKFRNNATSSLLKQAVNASERVINSGEYELFRALGDSLSYRYLFSIDNNVAALSNPAGLTKSDINEYLIKRNYSQKLNVTHGHTHAIAQQVSWTKKMADMYLCRDGLPIDKSPLFQGRDSIISEYKNRDSRMHTSFRVPGRRHYSYGVWGRRFDNPENPGDGIGIYKPQFGTNTITGYSTLKTGTESRVEGGLESADYPVMRYAEVLLIYAEAKYERDGSISDADLDKSINKLRSRVGMPSLTNAFVNQHGLDMRKEIRRERTVELAFEGFRLDDLKRWKTAEEEMPMAIRGVKFTGTEYERDPFYAGVVEANIGPDGYYVKIPASKRQFQEKHYLFPLPKNQVEMMGIEQNPGW